MSVQSIFVGLLGLVGVTAAAAARAGVPVPLGAPVMAIGAGPSRLLVATPRDVLLLDRHGRIVRRLPLEASSVSQARPAVADDPFAIAAGLSGADDFDEAYDVDLDVEDAENVTGRWTRGAPRRRPPPVPAQAAATVVSVDERFAWWGTPDGLWRTDLEGVGAVKVLRAQGDGVRALATSPDGRRVMVLSDGVMLRSLDGGNTFGRLFPVAGGRADVAMTTTGTAFVLDTSGLQRLPIDSTTPDRMGVPEVTALASCGTRALLVAAGTIFVVEDGRNEPTPIPGATQVDRPIKVTCSTDGRLWAALGTNLWMSHDGGRAFVPLPDQPAASGLAATQDGVWMATNFGLWFESGQPPVFPTETPPRQRDISPQAGSPMIRDVPWWLFVLPRVDIGFVSAQSSRQRDLRAFALLTFTLDRNAARAIERHSLLTRLAAAQRNRTPWPATETSEAAIHAQETDP